MKTHSKVLLAVVFVLGCFASQVAREVAVPRPVQAQTADGGAAPAGTRWEYACTEGSTDSDDMAAELNRWGQRGWELVTASDHLSYPTVYCFKQPL